jgi:hypothetical protein
MMRLIGYDFVDPGNFIQASHDRHHTCDRDLSGKVAGSRIDGGQVYSRPNKVELFYRLTQKLVTVNENESLISRSTQAGLENVAEDDGFAAPRREGNQSRRGFLCPSDEGQRLLHLSERDRESFRDGISLCLHICGLRGIQGAAAQQDSFFARSLIGAKDDPLDLLDPVRTKKTQLLLGLRISQERDSLCRPVEPAD